ncbi:hypothetical protein BDR26DRAFT_896815 [Obelidium mucronatum]|nr:hypothetical protein BDR26DRAFT_896815 [Obelidium mucronatum]
MPNSAKLWIPSLKQFPVISALACAPEKLQGVTLEPWITISDLDRPNFNPQTFYVAFSRVRSQSELLNLAGGSTVTPSATSLSWAPILAMSLRWFLNEGKVKRRPVFILLTVTLICSGLVRMRSVTCLVTLPNLHVEDSRQKIQHGRMEKDNVEYQYNFSSNCE